MTELPSESLKADGRESVTPTEIVTDPYQVSIQQKLEKRRNTQLVRAEFEEDHNTIELSKIKQLL